MFITFSKFFAPVVLFLAAGLCSGQELLTRPLDIGSLTQSAGTIVHGRIVDVQQGTHPDYPNIPVLNVTVEVMQNVRGAIASRISFRQYVQPVRHLGAEPAAPAKTRFISAYHAGEEVVLFLYPSSRYGLTSPVGAEQGHFTVVRDSSGAHVRNRLGNAALFNNLQAVARQSRVQLLASDVAAAQKPADITLDNFLSLVSRFAQTRRPQ